MIRCCAEQRVCSCAWAMPIASLSEIIAESQVTKGALYFHFGSKEELARAVIDEGSARFDAKCELWLDRRTPALESTDRYFVGPSSTSVRMTPWLELRSACWSRSGTIGAPGRRLWTCGSTFTVNLPAVRPTKVICVRTRILLTLLVSCWKLRREFG